MFFQSRTDVSRSPARIRTVRRIPAHRRKGLRYGRLRGERLEWRTLLASDLGESFDDGSSSDESDWIVISSHDGSPHLTSIRRRVPTSQRTNADEVTFRVTFSEGINAATVNASDFALNGPVAGDGTIGTPTAVSATVFDVQVTGLASSNGELGLDIAPGATIRDTGGTLMNDFDATDADDTYILDNLAPRLSNITRQVPTAAQTNADQVTFRVIFSEGVTGVDSTDFTLSGTAAGDGTLSTVTVVDPMNPTTYDVTVTGLANSNGTVGLDLASGFSIADLATNALTDPAVTGNDLEFTIDNLAPRVASILRQSPTSPQTNVDAVTFRVIFSEGATGVDAGDFVLTGSAAADGTINTPAVADPMNPLIYDISVTGLANSNGTVGLDFATGFAISDLATNPLTDAVPTTNHQSYTIDNLAPQVANIVRQVPTSPQTNVNEVTFRIIFSEGVTGLDVADLVLSGTAAADGTVGTPTVVDPMNPTTYDVTITGLASSNGTVGLDLASGFTIADLATNALDDPASTGNDQTFTIDNLAPRLSSIVRQAPASPQTNADEVTFRVIFSEGTSNVDVADFELTGTAAADGTISNVTVVDPMNPTNYDVTVTGLTDSNGTVGLDLAPGFGIADLATNAMTDPAATTNDQEFTIDNIEPRIASIVRQTPAVGITNADSIIFRVIFSEGTSGVEASDFQLSGTAAADGSIGTPVMVDPMNPTTYDITITGLADSNGTIGLELATGFQILDLATNPLTESAPTTNNQTFTIDNLAPSIASVVRLVPTAAQTNADEVTFRVIFSEGVTGVEDLDFRLAGTAAADGTIGTPRVTDPMNPTTYDITITGLSDSNGTLALEIDPGYVIFDLAVNAMTDPNPTTANQQFTIDNIAPRLASVVRQLPSSPQTNADEVTFRVIFSESISGLSASDLVLTGTAAGDGTIGNPQLVDPMNPSTYDVVISGLTSSNGTIELDLASGFTIEDLATNPLTNPAPTTSEQFFTIDNVAPRLASILRQVPGTQQTNVDAVTFRVVFSESVSGVDAADFVLSGTAAPDGVLGVPQVVDPMNPTTYDVAVTGLAVSNGTVGLDLANGFTITDLALNAMTESVATSADQEFTIDNVAPRLGTISRQVPALAQTNADEVTFRVVFNDGMIGVDASDFVLSGTIAAEGVIGVPVVVDPMNPTTFDVPVTGLTSSNGTLNLDLSAAVILTDLAGNPLVNPQALGNDDSFLIDNTPPLVTLSSPSVTNVTSVSVTVAATDVAAISDGTEVRLDVDLNNDNDFADPGETAYTVAGISGGAAVFDIAPDLSQGTYRLRARLTDRATNEGFSNVTTLTVDRTPPNAGAVASTNAAGAYTVGAVLDITVAFDEIVLVTGSPQLMLETGATDRKAVYTAGSGTNKLTFEYTIQPGDSASDLDYASTESLTDGAIHDAAGNVAVRQLAIPGAEGSLARASSLLVDTAAPLVSVDVVATTSHFPTLTGTVVDQPPSGGVEKVTVVVGGQTLEAAVTGIFWLVTVPVALNDDTYDVVATAVDAAGNSASDLTLNELIIDSVLPVVTVTGQVTRNNKPVLSGIVNDPPPSAGILGVSVQVGGQLISATVSGNTWTATVPVALADGTYDVVATASHATGGASSDTTTNELVVDTAAPQVTVTPLSTSDSTPILVGTLVDGAPSSGLSGVSVSVGGQVMAAVVVGNTWTASVPLTLVDGTFNIQVTAMDRAGNSGSDTTTAELVIDTVPPTITVEFETTSDATPTLRGTVRDPSPGSGIERVSVSVAGQLLEAAVAGETWSVTVPLALADGIFDVHATATDRLGHSTTDATSQELKIDTTAPSVTVFSVVTNDRTPSLTGSVSDAAPSTGIHSVVVEVGGQVLDATISGNSWTVLVPASLVEGTFDVKVTAKDVAGNIGLDVTSSELVVDTVAPAITVNAISTNDKTPTFTGTVTDPLPSSGIVQVMIEVNGQLLEAVVSGTTWMVTWPAELAEGVHSVLASARDQASNQSVDPTSLEAEVDTKVPTVTVNTLVTSDSTPTLTGTLGDAAPSSGIRRVVVSVGGQVLDATILGNNWMVTVPVPLADGLFQVQATITDDAGNTAVDTTAGELFIDTIQPVITVDAIITNDDTPTIVGTITDPGATSGIKQVTVAVGGNLLTASINANTWSVTVTDKLLDGTFSVQATATDQAGNSTVDSTSQELIVDTISPSAATLSTPRVAENSAAGTRVGDLTAVDAGSDELTFTLLDNAGGRFEIVGKEVRIANGAALDFETSTVHRITVQTSDPAGNASAATITISVTDVNDPPRNITLSSDKVLENVTGATIGDLAGQDDDSGQTLTFTTTDPRFEIVGKKLKLKNDQFLERDAGATVSVVIQVTDSGNPAITITHTQIIQVESNRVAWQNVALQFDVSGDLVVVPLDALRIINLLNNPTILGLGGSLPKSRSFDSFFYDVNGDGFCTSNDVLRIVNYLNSVVGEGEGSGSAGRVEYSRIDSVLELDSSGETPGLVARESPGGMELDGVAITESVAAPRPSNGNGGDAVHDEDDSEIVGWEELEASLDAIAIDIHNAMRGQT